MFVGCGKSMTLCLPLQSNVIEAPANASWTLDDESTFIAYLLEHKVEGGDGGNFKIATWNAAVKKLNENVYKGGRKTGLGCKGKWAALSDGQVWFSPVLPEFSQTLNQTLGSVQHFG